MKPLFPFNPAYNNLYIDSDGVMANFDKLAGALMGCDPRQFELDNGSDDFWEVIANEGDFFNKLELLPDAMELFNAVQHFRPIILTGAPSYIPDARDQKIKFYRRHLPGTIVVACQSKKKVDYCRPGDIIIDDWPKHQSKWEEAGGTWIVHTSAENSINHLKELGII